VVYYCCPEVLGHGRKYRPAIRFSALLMAGSIHASAETAAAPETVTVTATKLRKVFHKFLKGFVAPTEVTGKIASWKRRICPHVL
jgi:hypothetical protein